MNKKLPLLLAFLAFGSTAVFSQVAQQSYTLTEAVEYAKKNSPNAKVANADLQIAYWNYRFAKATLYPELSMSADLPGLNRRINPVTQPDGSILFVPQSQSVSSTNLFLAQNITTTGGTLYISSGLSRIQLFNQNNQSFWQANIMQVGITQPIFNSNRLRYNWLQSKLRYDMMKRRATELNEQLSISVTEAFYDLYILVMQSENAEANKTNNDSMFNIAVGRFNVGKISENEKLQAELNLMRARTAADQIRINKDIAEKRLKNLCGIDPSIKISITPSTAYKTLQVDYLIAIREARENRSEFVNFEIQKNENAIIKREATYGRLPSGQLNASFGLNQTATTIDNAYKNPLDAQVATITLNVPLLNFGKNKSRYEASKIEIDKYKEQMKIAVNDLELQILSSVEQFNQLARIVEVSARADSIARQRYEITTNRFKLGKIDLTNLIIAQNEKDDAIIDYYSNLKAYWIAYYRVRQLTLFDFETNKKLLQ